MSKEVIEKQVTLASLMGEPSSREEALALVKENPNAYEVFETLDESHQLEILEFIRGNKGIPILYDGFYKYIFDPERHPERLESFLSELFGQPVHIEKVLPQEGNKLAEDGTLVVMDIIVRLSDGSIVDVEMQKCGYMFTGERSSCYISDMIMRQYNRIRAQKKKHFKFSQMKPVYLVILMENSSKEFKKVAPAYIHRLQNSFDSGVNLKMLSNLTYISLDTFRALGQNINNRMDAWMTFFSSDKPEDMIQLVQKYPEFEECYHDIAMFRKRPEELMSMFSEALLQMDRNTVKYMIEVQQQEIDEQKKVIEENAKIIKENAKTIEKNEKIIEENEKIIEENEKIIEENTKTMEANAKELLAVKRERDELEEEIKRLKALLEK